jgi:hypothetical protein
MSPATPGARSPADGTRGLLERPVISKLAETYLSSFIPSSLPDRELPTASAYNNVRKTRITPRRLSQAIGKERFYLDSNNRDVLHNEITTIDRALTRP